MSSSRMPLRASLNGLRCLLGCGIALVMIALCHLESRAVAQEPGGGQPSPAKSAEDRDATAPLLKSPETKSDDVDLDALLDLADKTPEQLQSIGIKNPTRDLGLDPEMVFTPDQNNSSNSIGELLSQAPGVVSRSTSTLNQDARVRGFSGSQVVGIANGMNQGKTRLDIDSLFSQIDPNLVDSVTVIAGAYAVEFGPGFAFFDARLIEPRRSDQFTSDSTSTVGMNTNGRQLMWRETGSFSDRHSGAIVSFGQRMGSDYRVGSGSDDFHVPASYNVQDVFASISSDITARSRINATYLHQSIQNTELPGVAYDINQQNADQINLRWTWRDDSTNTDRLQTQFWWNQASFNANGSRPSKLLTFSQVLLGQPYPDMANGGMIVGNGLSDNWGARAVAYFGDGDTWQLRTGTDWRRVRQFYREDDFEANGTPTFGGDTFGIPDSSADDFGIFAGSNLNVTERWSVGAGQRLDVVRYNLNSTDVVDTNSQNSPNGTYTPGFNSPTRGLSMSYLTSKLQATDDLTINAGVSYAMRPANLTELYSDQPFAPLVRFGNSFAFGDSTLGAEKNLQFDLGFTKRQERSSFGARAFHSTIHDYIGLAATNYGTFPQNGVGQPGTLGRGRYYMADPAIPNQDISSDAASLGYIYRNINMVTLTGFDVLGEQKVRPWLEFAETINFTYGTNYDPTWVDVYTGVVHHLGSSEGLTGVYPFNATLTARLVEPEERKWTLEWQSRIAHRQYHLAQSLGEVGTPSFMVHNLHANYRFSKYISLRTSLLNVFNLNYYEHNSLAIVDRTGNVTFVKNPGISWYAGVECQF